jgi:tRNA dimethylallyltransferase
VTRRAAIALLGPTGTGKTGIALRLAEATGAEIISVDSRQAYRGMAVGTAAPTAAQQERVPHHGVGILEPGERYGAGRFGRLAREWMDSIRTRGHEPLLVGGTGFFYRALVQPIFREPELDRERRSRLEAWIEAAEPAMLAEWVRRLDPELAARLPVLDPQRVQRALEVALLTGRPLTSWQRRGTPEAEPVATVPVVLELEADEHRRRLRQRAESMLDGGWKEEVERLLDAGHDRSSIPFRTIGYAAVAEWLAGGISRDDALACILRDTWAYARRQRTWFRHQMPADTIRLDAGAEPEVLAARIVRAAGGEGPDSRERER